MLETSELQKAKKRYRAELARLPDPEDVAIPNKRKALREERARLERTAGALHHGVGTLESVNRRRAPMVAIRDSLQSAQAVLLEQLSEAEAKLETIKREKPERKNWRQQEREVADLEGAIVVIHEGPRSFGVMPRSLPAKLAAAMPPGADWSQLKPLPHLERMIADLDKRLEDLANRVRPYLEPEA